MKDWKDEYLNRKIDKAQHEFRVIALLLSVVGVVSYGCGIAFGFPIFFAMFAILSAHSVMLLIHSYLITKYRPKRAHR